MAAASATSRPRWATLTRANLRATISTISAKAPPRHCAECDKVPAVTALTVLSPETIPRGLWTPACPRRHIQSWTDLLRKQRLSGVPTVSSGSHGGVEEPYGNEIDLSFIYLQRGAGRGRHRQCSGADAKPGRQDRADGHRLRARRWLRPVGAHRRQAHRQAPA